MSEAYLSMAQNNAWANATLYTALKPLSVEAFNAPRPGFFSSLGQTMNHIYGVDLYYLDALEQGGLGRRVYDRDAILHPTDLAEAQAESDARFIRFCKELSPEFLTAQRITERPDAKVEERVDALLLHLVQHQIHHRGQAHVQLHSAGHAPPQLDDFYLTYGRVPSAEHYRT